MSKFTQVDHDKADEVLKEAAALKKKYLNEFAESEGYSTWLEFQWALTDDLFYWGESTIDTPVSGIQGLINSVTKSIEQLDGLDCLLDK